MLAATAKQYRNLTNGAPKDGFYVSEPQIDYSALDYLMSETDVQFLKPVVSRRSDAIAQLKAAFATKQAACKMNQNDNNNRDLENAFQTI